MNIYEDNYQLLVALLGCTPGELMTQKIYPYRGNSPVIRDVLVERLQDCPETMAVQLYLCQLAKRLDLHYIESKMKVRVFPPGCERFHELAPSTDPGFGRVEPLSFKQEDPPVNEVVYTAPGRCDALLKDRLNSHLATWLGNLQRLGYRIIGDLP